MKALVFATSYLAGDLGRYLDWVSYYREFFAGADVDLLLVNDGPTTEHMGCRVCALSPHLGRPSLAFFPGWKRSFAYGLMLAQRWRYDQIAHVEADCYITWRARQRFLEFLRLPGYFTGFCTHYRFPETALQVLNCKRARRYLIRNCLRLNESNPSFEHSTYTVHPHHFLFGVRYEDRPRRLRRGYDYLAQIRWSDFKRYQR